MHICFQSAVPLRNKIKILKLYCHPISNNKKHQARPNHVKIVYFCCITDHVQTEENKTSSNVHELHQIYFFMNPGNDT